MLKINLTSVPVSNQAKALDFYTRVLGFVKKSDIPVGEYRGITVVSASGQSDVELALEPMAFEPAKIYQNALKQADIPYTAFSVDDIDSEYQRLVDLGVVFLNPPKEVEGYKIAMLDDTCGNYIQLLQKL